jgi:quercetin dioxygenase-like cupin family protein
VAVRKDYGKFFILLILVLFLSVQGVYSQELVKSKTSWDGGEISYPPGRAEITSMKIMIKRDEVTKFHCHPVPTLAYVVSGTIEVETKDGNKIQFHQGESLVEVMRTVHRGKAVDGEVEIVVFYAGSVLMPNTVLPENDSMNQYCNGLGVK